MPRSTLHLKRPAVRAFGRRKPLAKHYLVRYQDEIPPRWLARLKSLLAPMLVVGLLVANIVAYIILQGGSPSWWVPLLQALFGASIAYLIVRGRGSYFRYYREVPQGRIRALFSEGGGMLPNRYYVVLEGYTRANELRTGKYRIDEYDWRTLKEGTFFDRYTDENEPSDSL